MASVEIEGKEYSIAKILNADFIFTIPLYQRPYSWTVEQAGELLDDLLEAINSNSANVPDLDPYFLGSMVLIKPEKSKPAADVVDGQQRLTTLTILLSALRATLNPTHREAITKLIYEKGSPLFNSSDRYLLSLREQEQPFFQAYIQQEGGIDKLRVDEKAILKELSIDNLNEPKKYIRSNALHFLQKLQDLDETQRERLAAFILTRCFMVIVSTPDMDSAYRIFTVLNDRGLDLTPTDILKSEIIGKLPHAFQDSYGKIWEDLEETLGREDFLAVFTHIRAISIKAKPRESLIKDFRLHVKPASDPKNFIDKQLVPYAKAYKELKTASYENKQDAASINNVLEWLNRINNVDWLPVALFFYINNRLEPEKLLRFFTYLERLAAGMMIMSTYITPRVERYAKILSAIDKDENLYDETSPLQLDAIEKTRIANILDGPIYLNRTFRLYVLTRLDAKLADAGATFHHKIITVEHVLPQNPSPTSEWVKWFPDDDEREKWVHRLGNLALLSRSKNSSASNLDFTIKKNTYFSQRINNFPLTIQVLQKEKWTPQIVNDRQKELLKHLKDIWQLD